MKWLSRRKQIADPRARVVAADVARLDAFGEGSADDVMAYVLSGKDETVLAPTGSAIGRGYRPSASRMRRMAAT